jgi:hypothetical protein
MKTKTKMMSIRKKTYLAIYVTCVTVGFILFKDIVISIKNTPSLPVTPEEVADTSIGQYTERLNSSATTTSDMKKPPTISSFIPSIFAETNPIPAGCSLRFAFTPENKTLTSGSINNYTATLSNRGKDACKNVSLSIYYGKNEHFVSSTPAPRASDYYWVIGNLPYLKTYSISLVTKITNNNDGENMISSACASADNSPDVCSDSIIFVNSTTPKISSATSTGTNTTKVSNTLSKSWGESFNKKEFGIWVWDSPIKMTQPYVTQVITNAKKNNFNTIYLSIDDYIPITQITDNTLRTNEKEKYMQALSTFIAAANVSGIQVDAVGGEKYWAQTENRWKGYALIDFVNEYNTRYPNTRLRNIQYDVEPYLLPNYAANKEKTLKEYVEFIDESARRIQLSSVGLSVVIPHFYDDNLLWTPMYNYNGENGYTFTHLLKILSKKESNEIIVMAYRNFFNGDDGIEQISKTEIDEASQTGYKTKIIIAQETGDVSPDYVTYYGHTKNELSDTISQIQNYFGNDKNYGGVAVHYFDSFLKLKEEN